MRPPKKPSDAEQKLTVVGSHVPHLAVPHPVAAGELEQHRKAKGLMKGRE